MAIPGVLPELRGLRTHFVGVKGTGMCALAEIFVAAGARVSGSDVGERFYTDAILESLGIAASPFDADNVGPGLDLVVHSAAYRADTHPELLSAAAQGIPVLNYPEALGAFSERMDSSGIAGVHGKTTTTAMAGAVARGLKLPATALAGSAVSSFGGRCTWRGGDRFFIAETCEYRRHFMHFSPRRIVLTSVESDHQDYYPDYASILSAFVDYIGRLPTGGSLIYCADDPGAAEAARAASARRPDIRLIPYGFEASGPYAMSSYGAKDERALFTLGLSDRPFALRVPGRHMALDAAAALALCFALADEAGLEGGPRRLDAAREALESFAGTKRRAEILGEARGILFMDDYAHHPAAIKATLAGLREFYPARRLVVDFMSHTYSRTSALFDDFSRAFGDAELLFCNKIYASAREAPLPGVDGRSLCDAVRRRGVDARYIEEPLDAIEAVAAELRPGDLFITMGAGDNWALGAELYARMKG